MRFSFIYHSRVSDEVFALDCLDDRLGDEVTFKKDMGGSYSGTLVAAEVIEDGQAIRITLDVPDEALSDVQTPLAGVSVGIDTCDRHVPGFGRCGLTRPLHTVDRVNHPFTLAK